MDIDEVIQLIQVVSENKLTSFEPEEGSMKLSLKCKKGQPQIPTVSAPSMDQASVQMINTATAVGTGVCLVLAQEASVLTAGVDIGSDKVTTSSFVEIFYTSSSPDADVSVKAGDTVREGQVLGIIEVMKLMNEIENECDGVVEAILANSEEVVEYGQSLFRTKWLGGNSYVNGSKGNPGGYTSQTSVSFGRLY